MTKKLEQEYKKNNEEINEAIGQKNYALFDHLMGHKMCLDVHVFGKGTLALFRSLFTFTHALLITVANSTKVSPQTFKSPFSFQETACVGWDKIQPGSLPVDF